MVESPECVAVGECGLDFNRNFSPPEVQLEVFEEQIRLACRVGKPLFLHEREAHEDMVRLLEKYKSQLPSCVIHCFTGTKEQAVKYLSMGCYIGLTGNTTITQCSFIRFLRIVFLKVTCGKTSQKMVSERFYRTKSSPWTAYSSRQTPPSCIRTQELRNYLSTSKIHLQKSKPSF